MKIYILFYGTIVVTNIVYSVKLKVKKWILAYEVISGPFLIFLTLALWIGSVRDLTNAYMPFLFVAIIIFDFYYTMWGKSEELSEEFHGVGKKELEFAKAMSIAFTAPAYICSALLCAELL